MWTGLLRVPPRSSWLLPGWAAGLTRWILPDPSIGTGSRVAQAAQAVVVGVGTQGLVSPRSNALGASFGVCSQSMLECQLASWACGRLVEGEGSVSSLRPQPVSPTCRDMAPPSQTELRWELSPLLSYGMGRGGKNKFFLKKKKEAAGSRAWGRVGRESRPSSRGTLRHGLHWRGEKLKLAKEGSLHVPPRGISLALPRPWMSPRCTTVLPPGPGTLLLTWSLGIAAQQAGTTQHLYDHQQLPFPEPTVNLLGSHNADSHHNEGKHYGRGTYLGGDIPEKRRRREFLPPLFPFSFPFPTTKTKTGMASISNARPSRPMRRSVSTKEACPGRMPQRMMLHTLRELNFDSNPLPPAQPGKPASSTTQYPNPAYHSRQGLLFRRARRRP